MADTVPQMEVRESELPIGKRICQCDRCFIRRIAAQIGLTPTATEELAERIRTIQEREGRVTA